VTAAILAYGAVSALGTAADAIRAGDAGAPARTVIAADEELAAAGLLRPFAARAWPMGAKDRAAAMLGHALGACAGQLDAARAGWRKERVGLVLGTSSGGMRAAERAFVHLAEGKRPPDPAACTYGGPMAAAARQLAIDLDPCVLVLGACASAVLAIGLAVRWLERGACDLAIAGGFDEVTVFVASGFECLRATTASPPPRPFRKGRDGMCLGEGAAVVALSLEPGGCAMAYVTGFGAASDAVHLTAPDREGAGLARAGRAAMREAGPGPVDLVSAHATATPFNDAAESRALAAVLGTAAADVVVHPFKAQIGHTLGAAGALELLACVDSMQRGVLPAAAGEGELDPDAAVRLLALGERGRPRRCLKFASAFGGANAAVVISDTPVRGARARRAAFLGGAVHVREPWPIADLAAQTSMAPERVERADRLVRLAWSAGAALAAAHGPLGGAGLVVGTALGPIETNAAFSGRLRAGGIRAAEPRRFAYTSPNTAAGECSIAFGLTGPSFAVGGGAHAAIEALATAALLVESGDADEVVVVAADDAGPVTRALAGDGVASGAIACIVRSEPRPDVRARFGAMSLRRGGPPVGPAAFGHAALLPLVGGAVPSEIVAVCPPDMVARLGLVV
jgi:3-oxoacyl-[acyl-carrier-protein] synthase II